MPTYRVLNFQESATSADLRHNLDLLEERREIAALREAKYKATIAQHYNAKVKNTQFKPGDLVLRKNSASRVEGQSKLDANWEGPYRVEEAYRSGSYKLITLEGKPIPRAWHVSNLRRYYY